MRALAHARAREFTIHTLVFIDLNLFVNSANEEIVRLQKQSDAEILRLETSLKRYELRVHNLEQAVEQKAGLLTAIIRLLYLLTDYLGYPLHALLFN